MEYGIFKLNVPPCGIHGIQEAIIATEREDHVSNSELDNAMAMAVEVDESLRVEEKHLKAEQYRKEEKVPTIHLLSFVLC